MVTLLVLTGAIRYLAAGTNSGVSIASAKVIGARYSKTHLASRRDEWFPYESEANTRKIPDKISELGKLR